MAPKHDTGPWDEANEKILIAFYAEHPVLWNPRDTDYFDRERRDSLLTLLRDRLFEETKLDVTVNEIQTKFNKLRNSFVREGRKVIASNSSGVGGSGKVHVPTWVHYQDLTFLLDTAKPNEGQEPLAARVSTRREEPQVVVVEGQGELRNDIPVVHGIASVPADRTSRPDSDSDSSDSSQYSSNSSSPSSSDVDSDAAQEPMKRSRSAIDEACLNFLEHASRVLQVPGTDLDHCAVFGNHVALSLRQLPEMLQEEAKMEIQELLYNFSKRMRETPAE